LLNPFTIYGKLGFLLAPFLFLFTIVSGSYKPDSQNNLFLFLLMFFIACWGVLFSFVNAIGQFNHLWVVFSLLITLFSAQGLFELCRRLHIDFETFLLLILYVFLLNYLLIIFEFKYPGFRENVEAFLVPSGNVDWRVGFRYRGVASGGGATLSLVTPVVFAITLHLYNKNRIGFLHVLVAMSIALFSTLIIGRTGLILLPLVFLCYIFEIFKKKPSMFSVFNLLSLITVFVCIGIFFYEPIVALFTKKFGSDFINYSFGFLLNGSKGIKSEGTTSIILHFLTVVPKTFPEVLTGYGFYGGSNFEPWTDSGYSRMFLSVGFFFGIIFYVCIVFFYFKDYKYQKFLISSIGLVLLVAEAKEPFLFSGYAARTFIFIIIFIRLDVYNKKRLKFKNGSNSIYWKRNSSSKIINP
jgi:hypothetical protein